MIKLNSYLVGGTGTSLFLAISLLIVTTGLFINDFLYSFFKFFMGLNLVVIGLLLIKIVLTLQKLRKNIIMALFINLFLIVYAFFFGLINDGIDLAEFKSYLYLVSSLVFTLAIFFSINENDCFLKNKIKNNFSLKKYIPMNYKFFGIFFIFFLLIVYVNKGFSFSTLKINYATLYNDNIDDYSQSVTAFFGLGAIFFTFLACVQNNKIRIFILIVALLYLFISFLGGARGEFIIVLLIINLILFKFLSIGQIILYIFFLSGLVVGNLFYEIIDFKNFIIIKRFSVTLFEKNFSYRDILFRQSLELMSDRWDCVLIGCGFNFFQSYYSYDFGMYPHNSFLELIITFGLISVPLILFAVLGSALGYLTKFGNTFMFYVLLFFFGISLKSDTILSTTTIPIFLYFCYIALKVLNPILSHSLRIFRK